MIPESALDEVNAFQIKYYARGTGNVRIGWRGKDATKEELELVNFAQLDPQAIAKIGLEALELERHAYEVSPEVYALSAPLTGGIAHASQRSPAPQSEKSAASPVRKISDAEAKDLALRRVPGEVTAVDVERKLGKKRIVVEVIADADGAEIDVIIDMETGEVLAIEN